MHLVPAHIGTVAATPITAQSPEMELREARPCPEPRHRADQDGGLGVWMLC